MTDSPPMVTPIFDQLVAEFGLRDRLPPGERAQGAASGAAAPAGETPEEARPGAAV